LVSFSDQILQTNGECDEDEKYHQKYFAPPQKKASMMYKIPLWSANVLPTIATKAKEIMIAMKLVSTDKKATKKLFDDFKTFLKNPEEQQKILLNFQKAFGVLPKAEADKECKGFKPMKPDTCKLQVFKTFFPGLVYIHSAEYIKKIRAQGAEAERKLALWSKELKYPETIDWEFTFAVGSTFGSSGVGFCTPDTNAVQLLTPVKSTTGKIIPGKTIGKNVNGRAVGFSVFTHIVADFFGFGYTYAWDSTNEKHLDSVSLKFYLPAPKFGENDAGVMAGDAGAGPAAFALQIIPMIADMIRFGKQFYDHVQEQGGKWKEVKAHAKAAAKAFMADIKELVKFWLGVSVGGLVIKQLMGISGKSLMESLTGSSVTAYAWVDINFNWEDLGVGGGVKPQIEASASFFNIAELQLAIPGVGAVKPMTGFGTVLDLGAMVNNVANLFRKAPSFAERGLVHLEKPNKHIGLEDGHTGLVKAVGFEDVRTPRCRQCCEVTTKLIAGKKVDCTVQETEEDKQRCRFVMTDVQQFLESNRRTSEYFWDNPKALTVEKFNTMILNDAGAQEFIKEYCPTEKMAKEQGPGWQVVPWCESRLTCRVMGVACFMDAAPEKPDGNEGDPPVEALAAVE
jgi:hypothetical protein